MSFRVRHFWMYAIFILVGLLCMMFVKFVNRNDKKRPAFEVSPDHEGFIIESKFQQYQIYNENNISEEFKIFMKNHAEHIMIEAPTSINNIRYIQICHLNDDCEVQLGVVENNRIHLYAKVVDSNKAFQMLEDYYHSSLEVDLKEYHPVEFQ